MCVFYITVFASSTINNFARLRAGILATKGSFIIDLVNFGARKLCTFGAAQNVAPNRLLGGDRPSRESATALHVKIASLLLDHN